MTPLQALQAATSTAAGTIGLQATKGRIAPGADADVLVTRGNPSPTSERSQTYWPSSAPDTESADNPR